MKNPKTLKPHLPPLIKKKNKNLTDNQKKLGKVLEEFKNRSVFSLLENGGKFELLGPFYVVTPSPATVSF